VVLELDGLAEHGRGSGSGDRRIVKLVRVG
jgi:hypothetical protein